MTTTTTTSNITIEPERANKFGPELFACQNNIVFSCAVSERIFRILLASAQTHIYPCFVLVLCGECVKNISNLL